MNDNIYVVVLVAIGLYFLGQMLIDAYFRRKEKYVDKLHQKMKGDTNGTIE